MDEKKRKQTLLIIILGNHDLFFGSKIFTILNKKSIIIDQFWRKKLTHDRAQQVVAKLRIPSGIFASEKRRSKVSKLNSVIERESVEVSSEPAEMIVEDILV